MNHSIEVAMDTTEVNDSTDNDIETLMNDVELVSDTAENPSEIEMDTMRTMMITSMKLNHSWRQKNCHRMTLLILWKSLILIIQRKCRKQQMSPL